MKKLLFLVLASGAVVWEPRCAFAAPDVPPRLQKLQKGDDLWCQSLSNTQKAAHALNRLAFGPRPGEVEALANRGVDAWVEAQFWPAALVDAELERQIAALPLLNAGSERLQLAYEGDVGVLRRFLEEKNGEKSPSSQTALMSAAVSAGSVSDNEMARKARQRARAERMMRRYAASGLTRGASLQALGELTAAKIARAAGSPAQLQEVLVDFWSNHFNVDVRKGPVRVLKISDEKDAIRPHIFGNFRQLLGASAKSPAMLWYLDNARSTAQVTLRDGSKRGGLNENYARELMELHTLGVQGGYTQKDVTEVARAFTGWSIGGLAGGGRESENFEFYFRERAHDKGEKIVLGQVIPAGGGAEDGEKVLDILAFHPSTAGFIARKLCQRFAGDDPPSSLVKKVAGAFARSRGDLKTVYRALFTAPEFWSRGAYRSKIKSPFEFAVSSVRALDGRFVVPDATLPGQALWLRAIGQAASENSGGRFARMSKRPLASEIAGMGQPMYACTPPTGWSENSKNWVSASALIARLNFALALTGGRIGDVQLSTDTFAPTSLDALSQAMLSGEMSASTRQTIASQSTDSAKNRALVLGSPEFQRR